MASNSTCRTLDFTAQQERRMELIATKLNRNHIDFLDWDSAGAI